VAILGFVPWACSRLGNIAATEFRRYINDTVADVRYATADVTRQPVKWTRHMVNSVITMNKRSSKNVYRGNLRIIP